MESRQPLGMRPVAYAQELIDAFTWWLSEKAEWHLEHKANGGPIALQDWSAALFKDSRVAAAWPVIADAIYQVEKYKFDALDEEKKETRRKPKADDSYTAFERFFRELCSINPSRMEFRRRNRGMS